MKPLVAVVLLLIVTGVVADETDIAGRWLSGDKTGWIEIRLIDDKPLGIAAGATDPNDVGRVDELNPDPALRSRSLLGITILHGFDYAGEHVWKGALFMTPTVAIPTRVR
ncbi:MAG: DUF2147 domain-containing protein [Proteobacteria bacterium]|nr:DUF2147 domain-containing protein [Pseudomonadota bacterium]MDA1064806.1 DUF2147 domain-containing protein [Pseudomonadota bacterium]